MSRTISRQKYNTKINYLKCKIYYILFLFEYLRNIVDALLKPRYSKKLLGYRPYLNAGCKHPWS